MYIVATNPKPSTAHYARTSLFFRVFGHCAVFLAFVYLTNNYLNVWQDWPGVAHYFISGDTEGANAFQAWLQLLSYTLILPLAFVWCLKQPDIRLIEDSEKFSRWSAYVIRAAFWSVVLIGLVDGVISWLRVEDLLNSVFGETLGNNLGRSVFRGTYVHYPLIGFGFVLAYFYRTVSVSWLALLVVFAEAWIVVARFIFSYEQTLMGDLVRFWYAALLLFSSAYTLREEGHVRVDVLYAIKSIRYKAWANMIGIFLLALPLLAIILTLGMWEKSSIINSPLFSFEISQSSYGLYIKYLMAGFLVVFAVSMLLEFISYLLKAVAVLTHEVQASDEPMSKEAAQ